MRAVHPRPDPVLVRLLRPDPTRPDFADFPEVFGLGLFNALLEFDFDQAAIEQMLDQTRELRYAKTSNRRVIGSMNNMQQMLEWFISDAGGLVNADLAELHRRLNETPFKAIDYDDPAKRMRDHLMTQDSHRPGDSKMPVMQPRAH